MTTFYRSFCGVALLLSVCGGLRGEDRQLEADLLIVGGNESGCAAAVQAARLGVKRIVLVNDIDWLGGQFSAEGVGCLDEWTTVRGKRTNFPRSGLFREMVDRIRAHNSKIYGVPAPGNAYCGTETIEPRAAARLFEELLAPYTEHGTGQIVLLRPYLPVSVTVTDRRVRGVLFVPATGSEELVSVTARLTLDATDWGDVIRLSGARYGAGPDLRARFKEPSAPEAFDEDGRQEMNPLSWCLVLREAGRDATIPRPKRYDPRAFAALDTIPPWVDSDMSDGIYSPAGWSVYTHRRLVDRWHFGLPVGTECTFLNWPVQDYPLTQLPQHVVDALEATEAGASRKTIVDLSPAQRQIVFDDARQHALGLLYHLQTRVHDRVGDFPQSFRYLELTDEFGTPDRLPPKPYVREGLRLEALYMLREQDLRAADRTPRWARSMAPDGVLGFQFNIDFHPTRRRYLEGTRSGPWQFVHTASRNWHTDTDRAMLPLRSLVPVDYDGLLGCSKNIGVSSVVQSALRLHGQMMLVGQAAATLAFVSLRDEVSPRQIAASPARWRDVQLRLVRGAGGPGVLIWPWHDLPLDSPAFEAANLLAIQGIWPVDPDTVLFEPERTLTRRELARLLVRVRRARPMPPEWPSFEAQQFTDVPREDPDRPAIQSLIAWGQFGPQPATFRPEAPVDWATLHRWLTALALPAPRGLVAGGQGTLPLSRAEAARLCWKLIETASPPAMPLFSSPESDADGDGLPDRDDPLPLDRNQNAVPDLFEPEPQDETPPSRE